MKPLPLLLGLMIVFTVGLLPTPASEKAGAEVVELPPMVVEGRFEELVCGVRFRYNIPGNRMRSLGVRKMPAAWATAGVKSGDLIVAIDDRKIDGQGLGELCKYLSSKPRTGAVRFVFDVQSRRTRAVRRLEMVGEHQSGEITIAYP